MARIVTRKTPLTKTLGFHLEIVKTSLQKLWIFPLSGERLWKLSLN